MAHIIKSNPSPDASHEAAGQSVTRPLNFQLPDWSQRVDEYVAQAKAKAASIIAEAEKEAERIQQQARQQGLKAGRLEAAEAARQVAQRQMQTVIPALQQVTREWSEARDAWLAQWEAELLKLAVAIGGQLCGREIRHDPQITCQWVREALEIVNGPGRLIVRMHPQDLAALEPHTDQLKAALHPAAELVLTADPNVEAGGAVVQTEFGEIDQRLTARMERLREELMA